MSAPLAPHRPLTGESHATRLVVLGYLFPGIAMLMGAALAAALDGRDGVAALGAMGGFLSALILARLALALPLPPARRRVPVPNRSRHSTVSLQEFHHD